MYQETRQKSLPLGSLHFCREKQAITNEYSKEVNNTLWSRGYTRWKKYRAGWWKSGGERQVTIPIWNWRGLKNNAVLFDIWKTERRLVLEKPRNHNSFSVIEFLSWTLSFYLTAQVDLNSLRMSSNVSPQCLAYRQTVTRSSYFDVWMNEWSISRTVSSEKSWLILLQQIEHVLSSKRFSPLVPPDQAYFLLPASLPGQCLIHCPQESRSPGASVALSPWKSTLGSIPASYLMAGFPYSYGKDQRSGPLWAGWQEPCQ